jgi:hypothetical protein
MRAVGTSVERVQAYLDALKRRESAAPGNDARFGQAAAP